MYSKIERGERRVKREQITVIAKLLQTELAPEAFKAALEKAEKK